MTTFIKICLLLASTAGIGSAISIPLVYTTVNKQNSINLTSISEGGAEAGQLPDVPFHLNECSISSSENQEEVDFGDQSKGNICWKIDSKNISVNNKDEYSAFFKHRWGDREQNWNMSNNQNQWTQQCFEIQGTTSPWAILISEDNGEQYLGLCGRTDVSSTKFVKKQKEEVGENNRQKWTFSICESECWDLSQPEYNGNHKQSLLTQEKGNSWSKVLFYKAS